MNTKHTPGPWHVDGSAVRTNPESHHTQASWICQAVLTESNARLIAAAPDLLAALLDAERELNICAQFQPQASIALRTVRAAIAKAEQS